MRVVGEHAAKGSARRMRVTTAADRLFISLSHAIALRTIWGRRAEIVGRLSLLGKTYPRVASLSLLSLPAVASDYILVFKSKKID